MKPLIVIAALCFLSLTALAVELPDIGVSVKKLLEQSRSNQQPLRTGAIATTGLLKALARPSYRSLAAVPSLPNGIDVPAMPIAKCVSDAYNNSLITFSTTLMSHIGHLTTMFMNQSATAAEKAAAANAYCASNGPAGADNLARFLVNGYAECANFNLISSLWTIGTAGCTQTGNTRCNLLPEQSQSQCSNSNTRTTCLADPQGCDWRNNKCENSFRLLAARCTDPCMAALINTPFRPPDLQMMRAACAPTEGGRCAQIVENITVAAELDGNLGRYVWRALCNSESRYNCWTSFVEAAAEGAFFRARQNYVTCMASNASAASCNATAAAALAETQNSKLLLGRRMCDRNAVGFCLEPTSYSVAPTQRATFNNTCLDPRKWTMPNGDCDHHCLPSLRTGFAAIGCCARTLNAFCNPPPIDWSSIPRITRSASSGGAAVANRELQPLDSHNNMCNFNLSAYTSCHALTTELSTIGTCSSGPVNSGGCFGIETINYIASLHRACQDSDLNFINNHNTSGLAWDLANFCPSRCGMLLQQMRTYQSCLPVSGSDYLKKLVVASAACTIDPDRSGSHRCGEIATNVEQQMCYQGGSQSQCNMYSYCTWNTTLNKCVRNLPDAFYNVTCGTCLRRLLDASGDPAYADVMNVICPIQGGIRCFRDLRGDLLQEFDATSAATAAMVVSYCNDPNKIACLRRILQGTAKLVAQNAVSTFGTCITGGSSAPSVCVSNFKSKIESMKRGLMRADLLCLKNDTTYCIEYIASTSSSECVRKLQQGQCNATCNATLQANIAAMGCCAGVVNQYFATPTILPSDFPPIMGFNLSAVFQPHIQRPPPGLVLRENEDSVTPGEQGVQSFIGGTCGLYNLPGWNATFFKTCKRSRSSNSVRAAVPLRMLFSRISGDATLHSALLQALIQDFAEALGISPADLINPSLLANPSMVIPLSHSDRASGRYAAGQAVDSGAQFVTTIQTESSAATTAAGSQYESLSASNGLSFPAASSLLTTSCPECISQGGNALSTTTYTIPGGTSAATGRTLLLSIVMLLAALLTYSTLC